MIGQLLAGHYRVLEVLGAGGFGQTYITEDLHLPGNPKCVLKHLKPASTDRTVLDLARKLFEKEAIVLQQLGNHDRIPRLLAYFEEQQEFYLVQEYILGHPLSTELKEGSKWREPQVIELLQEILEILVFIHGQGVIHRDIKPDNIMRRNSDRRLILIDFGAIKQVRNQQMLHGQQTMTVAIGTPGYMPIEQASGAPRASSDLYSLGTIAIQALTGINPYNLPVDDGTGELKWEHLTTANPRLIAILQRMTRYHFKDRYHTATDALQAVNALVTGAFPPQSTYVQTPQSRPVNPSQAATVVAGGMAATTAPQSPQTYLPQPPNRNMFPLVAGVVAISTAIASFAWFSGRLLNQRTFETDVRSDLCRIAAPTDLPQTRVRSQPQRDAAIQANLARGTKVVYLEEKDAFVKIQMADRTTGWVFNNQIADCKTPPATPKPTTTPSIAPPKPTPTPTPRVERTPVVTPTPTATPSVTPNPTESPIEIEVPTPTPTITPDPTIAPSASPTPTMTYPGRSRPTPLPSATITPTPTPTPSATPSSPPLDPYANPGNDRTPENNSKTPTPTKSNSGTEPPLF